MDIKSMHFDFKKKLNKVDSQTYRNLRVPEIDWALNEAQELFIKLIAMPRKVSHNGFEKTQRSMDDIRTIVTPVDFGSGITPVSTNTYALPNAAGQEYWHFVNAYVDTSKDGCTSRRARVFIRQQDDEFEESPFDKSSFEWKTVNGIFANNTIKLFTDGTFTNGDLYLGYIRRPAYMHNAEAHNAMAGYNLPDGTTLSGTQNCELPDHTHREIVDIAVLITTGEIENQFGYQFNKEKFNLNLNT